MLFNKYRFIIMLNAFVVGLIFQTLPGEGLEPLFSWVECHPLKNPKMFVQPLPPPPTAFEN